MRNASRAFWVLLIWVAVLSVLYSALSLVRHANFQSGGFDLGLYDQSVWQYSRFLWPFNTVKERFILGDHLTLTLPLLAPLYWIWDDVRILLIFQAVFISFSALAVFGIARGRSFSQFSSVLVAVLYSLFYGIQYAIFFDFHPVVLGVGLFVWFIYFFERGEKRFWIPLLFLVLLTQENMGLAIAGLGILYSFVPKRRTSGFGLISLGIIASLISGFIISRVSPVGFQYTPEISLNPIVLFIRFFDTQEKRLVWLYTASWFLFLPLFSIGSLLAVFFDLAQYFVTGPEFSRMWSPFMHHRAMLAPLVTLGFLDVLTRLRSRKIPVERVVLLVFISAALQQYIFHFPLNKLVKREFWQTEQWMIDNREMIQTIPESYSLATQQSLAPHLTHRNELYLMYPREHEFAPSPCGRKLCWWLDFNNRAEYLLIDLHENQWLTQLLETNEHVAEALDNMEKMGKLSLVRRIGNIRLYAVVSERELQNLLSRRILAFTDNTLHHQGVERRTYEETRTIRPFRVSP